jgi:hypothetical protein
LYNDGSGGINGILSCKDAGMKKNACLAMIFLSFFFSGFQTFQVHPSALTSAGPTETAQPSTPTAIPPVYIKAFCTLIGGDPVTRVPYGTPIIIIWGWDAKTQKMLDDFKENNITAVTLDGKKLEGIVNKDVTKTAKGNPETAWYADAGILKIGTHVLSYDVTFKKKVDDGSSTYGPGGKTESLHDRCQVEVESSDYEAAPGLTQQPLPGKEVIPPEKLGSKYPWLALDNSARPAVYYYYFNLRKPPFDNLLVRQAFAAATDREELTAAAREMGIKDTEPATTYTPSETLGRDLYGEIGIPFDPSQAKQYFEQAGYKDPTKFPAVTLLIGVSGTDIPGYHEKMAEMVAGMWQKNLGVTINVEKLEFNAFVDRIFTDPPEIFRTTFYTANNDPDDFMRNFVTKTRNNLGGYANPDYDLLIEKALKDSPQTTRQMEYIQAESILNEKDTVILPVFHLTYMKK